MYCVALGLLRRVNLVEEAVEEPVAEAATEESEVETAAAEEPTVEAATEEAEGETAATEEPAAEAEEPAA